MIIIQPQYRYIFSTIFSGISSNWFSAVLIFPAFELNLFNAILAILNGIFYYIAAVHLKKPRRRKEVKINGH